MPWVVNVPKAAISKGEFPYPGPKSVLIQIVDPGTEFPDPPSVFSRVHRFEFLDLEREEHPDLDDFKISDEQATSLVHVVEQALRLDDNVVVHCVAGLCCSGAIVEVGIMMGFQDLDFHRQPNTLVKYKMMRTLGRTY